MPERMEDWIAVAEVANAYYLAMFEGQGDELRQLFDPRAPVVGVANGNFLSMSLDTFVERSEASIGQHGKAERRIESLSIIGDTAQVTVGGRYRKLWFTDQLAMVRGEDGWVIQTKIFFADGEASERRGGQGQTGSSGEDAAVIQAGNAYYRTMVEGDEEGLRALFASDAPIVGTVDGEFIWDSLDAFVVEAKDSVGKHGEIEGRIDALQVIGDTALVTVGGRYLEMWFTDQLAMVRGDDGWRIHGKTFHAVSTT
ncbi:MAG: nuclear transport factor 2 family protein [Alphaproteobacteria bacterium]|nr:nuclear transport factor 2 family protein [Alphaproteobacteria bacterium]